jgi:MFS family permease
MFACATGAATAGLVTFGVISYHLTQGGLVPLPAVPLIYAAAMATEALAALATGALFDRIGGRVLLGLPILVAVVPPLAFANAPAIAIVGVLIWGAAGLGLHSQGACRRARAVRATRDRLRRLRGSTGHIGHGGRRLGWSSVSAVLARAGSHRCRRPSSRPGS